MCKIRYVNRHCLKGNAINERKLCYVCRNHNPALSSFKTY